MINSKEQENQLYNVMLTVKAIDADAALYIIKNCEKKLCNMSSELSLEERLEDVEYAICNYLYSNFPERISIPVTANAFLELAHYYYMRENEHEAIKLFERVYGYLKEKKC